MTGRLGGGKEGGRGISRTPNLMATNKEEMIRVEGKRDKSNVSHTSIFTKICPTVRNFHCKAKNKFDFCFQLSHMHNWQTCLNSHGKSALSWEFNPPLHFDLSLSGIL